MIPVTPEQKRRYGTMTEADWLARYPRLAESGSSATTDPFWAWELTNEACACLEAIPEPWPWRIAEIGVLQAKNACIMLFRRPLLYYVGVDNWAGWPENRAIAERNLTFFPGRWELYQQDSTEAAARFEDGAFDVVFIDGSKDAGKYTADCLAWWPKVRTGGTMIGHDIAHPLWTKRDGGRDHVREQVDAFCAAIGKPSRYRINALRTTWSLPKE